MGRQKSEKPGQVKELMAWRDAGNDIGSIHLGRATKEQVKEAYEKMINQRAANVPTQVKTAPLVEKEAKVTRAMLISRISAWKRLEKDPYNARKEIKKRPQSTDTSTLQKFYDKVMKQIADEKNKDTRELLTVQYKVFTKRPEGTKTRPTTETFNFDGELYSEYEPFIRNSVVYKDSFKWKNDKSAPTLVSFEAQDAFADSIVHDDDHTKLLLTDFGMDNNTRGELAIKFMGASDYQPQAGGGYSMIKQPLRLSSAPRVSFPHMSFDDWNITSRKDSCVLNDIIHTFYNEEDTDTEALYKELHQMFYPGMEYDPDSPIPVSLEQMAVFYQVQRANFKAFDIRGELITEFVHPNQSHRVNQTSYFLVHNDHLYRLSEDTNRLAHMDHEKGFIMYEKMKIKDTYNIYSPDEYLAIKELPFMTCKDLWTKMTEMIEGQKVKKTKTSELNFQCYNLEEMLVFLIAKGYEPRVRIAQQAVRKLCIAIRGVMIFVHSCMPEDRNTTTVDYVSASSKLYAQLIDKKNLSHYSMQVQDVINACGRGALMKLLHPLENREYALVKFN